MSAIARSTVLAGLAGGFAEIVWVASFCAFTGADAAGVARQVTASLLPSLAATPAAAALGVAIHLTLALLLAQAFAVVVWRPFARRLDAPAALLVAVLALAAVWAVNFLLILPALNPAFVGLLPYAASLASKLLFGVAMGAVLLATRQPLAART